jgi:hypothetical protein
VPDILIGLSTIACVGLLFKIFFFLLLSIIFIIGVASSFFLCFGLLLTLLKLSQLLDFLGFIIINFFNGCALLNIHWSLDRFVFLGQFSFLLHNEFLLNFIFFEESLMFCHVPHDDLRGILILGEEVGFSAHEGEEVIEKVINTLTLLDCGHEKSIETSVFHSWFN